MEKERELENRSERTRAVHNKVTQINHQLGRQAGKHNSLSYSAAFPFRIEAN